MQYFSRSIDNCFSILCERAFFILDHNYHLSDEDKLMIFKKVGVLREMLEEVQDTYNSFENEFGI